MPPSAPQLPIEVGASPAHMVARGGTHGEAQRWEACRKRERCLHPHPPTPPFACKHASKWGRMLIVGRRGGGAEGHEGKGAKGRA